MRLISSHQFDVWAEHSQPRCGGWEPQSELCKWLNDRACSDVQPANRSSPPCSSYHPCNRADIVRPQQTGHVWLCSLTDATCWNAIFVVSTHREAPKAALTVLEMSFICFCSIASPRPWSRTSWTWLFYGKCEKKNKATSCWNCGTQSSSTFGAVSVFTAPGRWKPQNRTS